MEYKIFDVKCKIIIKNPNILTTPQILLTEYKNSNKIQNSSYKTKIILTKHTCFSKPTPQHDTLSQFTPPCHTMTEPSETFYHS